VGRGATAAYLLVFSLVEVGRTKALSGGEVPVMWFLSLSQRCWFCPRSWLIRDVAAVAAKSARLAHEWDPFAGWLRREIARRLSEGRLGDVASSV
jgi:hypothetical protein